MQQDETDSPQIKATKNTATKSKAAQSKTAKTKATTPAPGVTAEMVQETKTTEHAHLWVLGALALLAVAFLVVGTLEDAPAWLNTALLVVLLVCGFVYAYLNMRVFILKSERKRATKAALAEAADSEQR